MKIAICNVQEFNPTIGGIERVSVSLAEGLIKEGVEVLLSLVGNLLTANLIHYQPNKCSYLKLWIIASRTYRRWHIF